jgi:hypothetical protein
MAITTNPANAIHTTGDRALQQIACLQRIVANTHKPQYRTLVLWGEHYPSSLSL